MHSSSLPRRASWKTRVPSSPTVELTEAIDVHVRREDLGAFACESDRSGASDALRCSGDEGPLAGESGHGARDGGPPLLRVRRARARQAAEDLAELWASVRADRVEVIAITDSEASQRRLEADLAREAPEGLRLALSISAPRPVITPFTVRFVMDEAGPHFDACAADTEEGQRTILAAAAARGVAL